MRKDKVQEQRVGAPSKKRVTLLFQISCTAKMGWAHTGGVVTCFPLCARSCVAATEEKGGGLAQKRRQLRAERA